MSARQLVRVRQKVRGALGELPPEMKKDEQMPQVKDKDDVEGESGQILKPEES